MTALTDINLQACTNIKHKTFAFVLTELLCL